jgi:mono/diheme cytochrome c family protein
MVRISVCLAALALAPAASLAQSPPPGRETFQKVCGTCHPVETATSQRRSRAQWQENINSMIAKGAKATDEEFTAILEYLTTQHGPTSRVADTPAARASGAYSPGPADKHMVNAEAANRGRKVYAAECINCHGAHARGGDKGADLVRSEILLHDRYGSAIGPFLKKGHPTQTTPVAQLTDAQIEDLSHTLHQEVYNTLRSALQIQNVLTGDAKAGAAYFSGEGKCSTCHSPTGDLAKIGARFDPPALQQRFLFPGVGGGRGGRSGATPRPVTVTVTPPSGPAITGRLVYLDDFNVALRDDAGEYRSFQRSSAMRVEKHDPTQAHHDLLDRYTDKNVHDLVAYLETLK